MFGLQFLSVVELFQLLVPIATHYLVGETAFMHFVPSLLLTHSATVELVRADVSDEATESNGEDAFLQLVPADMSTHFLSAALVHALAKAPVVPPFNAVSKISN